MIKKVLTKTTTSVSNKIAVITLLGVVIISGSIIISTIFSTDLPKGLLATTTAKPPPPQGWCVTKLGLIGDNGIHTTKINCSYRENDNDDTTNWYTWCPDKDSLTPRSECSCDDSDAIPSDKLKGLIALRDPLIDRLNDGDLTIPDWVDSFEFAQVVKLNCGCGIFSANTKTNNDADILSLPGSPIRVEDSTMNNQVRGTYKLISMAAKLFSKMQRWDTYFTSPLALPKKYCTVFPEGVNENDCRITSSYDPTRDDDPSSPSYNPFSPHLPGEAIDISCGEPNSNVSATASPFVSACTGKTALMLAAIKANNPGFNIIEECNKEQSGCNGRSTNQVIHLDIKARAQEKCYMIDCETRNCVKTN